MDEMGRRFAGELLLTDQESKGVKIRASAVHAAMRCNYAIVCKGVSISDVEGNRFLVRFKFEKDMTRVLDVEPWDFDKSLVLIRVLKYKIAVTDVTLISTVFWVQIYGVLVRFCLPEVAEDIGGQVGQVVEVGKGDNGECVGCFLRVRVCIMTGIALFRCTVVSFPDFGDQEVEFKYERLPEFCQKCGVIGHPTRVCDEKLGIRNKRVKERPYQLSLRAEMDFHGRRLGYRTGRGRVGEGGSGSEASDSAGGSMHRSMESDLIAEGRDPKKKSISQLFLEAIQRALKDDQGKSTVARVLFPEEPSVANIVVPLTNLTAGFLGGNDGGVMGTVIKDEVKGVCGCPDQRVGSNLFQFNLGSVQCPLELQITTTPTIHHGFYLCKPLPSICLQESRVFDFTVNCLAASPSHSLPKAPAIILTANPSLTSAQFLQFPQAASPSNSIAHPAITSNQSPIPHYGRAHLCLPIPNHQSIPFQTCELSLLQSPIQSFTSLPMAAHKLPSYGKPLCLYPHGYTTTNHQAITKLP
ncbi:hypothetical protein M0R45_015521 [Rubus argutus]|uniref:Zinc knuckle CX2CX4HX4C domain-containing protein n=1 Tax=Rubus argutus TaxID=59490 RepID=A0AAW1XR45_RUBAR